MHSSDSTAARSSEHFASTHWSVVVATGTTDQRRSLEALQTLCETYWGPVYVFVRGKGFSPEDAEELTQSYFAKLLSSDSLSSLNRDKGRFRAFLLASVKNFLANEWDRRKTKKRGGDRTIVSLDQAAGEFWCRSVDTESPDTLFERRWVLTLLERVMMKLRDECERSHQIELFEALKPAVSGDSLGDTYNMIGARLGLTEGAVKVAVHRLRRKYRDLLRTEIGQTVASPSEIELEIQYLFQLFQ